MNKTKSLDLDLIITDIFQLDVIHFPFTTISPSFFDADLSIVLTIHDIQQEYYPEFFDRNELSRRRKTYKPSAEKADVIITLTSAAKQTIVEKYGISPEKIVVTYQACSGSFRKIENLKFLNVVRKRYTLPDEFMLYPASTWPHKNHIKLFEAMLILREKYSFKKALVLTGIPMNNHQMVMDAIKKFNLDSQIKFLHFVPFDDLPAIYNLANIMVFPSLFEGFGIPLVEAMNVGLPIACADRTSLPEIVGEAGIYFDPDNPKDIAEKIYRLWQDNALREKLINKGIIQAKKIHWEATIKKTIAAYELTNSINKK